ncbi:MAG: hypothetical protein ACRCX2_20360 [Paraclostridium sp.]
MKLFPELAVITFIGEEKTSAKGRKYRSVGLAIDSEMIVATVFDGISSYIGGYASKGGKLFVSDWNINKKTIDNIDKYDIIINKCKIA